MLKSVTKSLYYIIMDAGWSRKSEISISSSARIAALFDFSATNIHGLYKITSKQYVLEYKEDDESTNLLLRTKKCGLSADFNEEKYNECGIDYDWQIVVSHPQGEKFKILIPNLRSYDPAGLEKPYVTASQAYFIQKLVAAEVKAAICGVSEQKIDFINDAFYSLSKIYKNTKHLTDWIHLQIKNACFTKTKSIKYFEFLIQKVTVGELLLNDRNHCKEYLESCLKGGQISIPCEYYKSVVLHETKLSFEKKVIFSEIICRENKKVENRVLTLLPKFVPNIIYVKQGKSYNQLLKDSEKYYSIYNSPTINNPCKIM